MSPSTERLSEIEAGPDDFRGDGERDHGVEPRPAGHGDRADAREHAGGRPDVGHQVVAVGFERDRVVPPARREQHARDAEIDERSDDRQSEPDAELIERARMDQPLDRGDADQRPPPRVSARLRARSRNTRPCRGRTDGLRPPGARRRSARTPRSRRDEIHQRFERVGEQAHRARQPVCGALESDDDDRRSEREPRVAGERWTGRCHSQYHTSATSTSRIEGSELKSRAAIFPT